jgi:hypothetical protein
MSPLSFDVQFMNMWFWASELLHSLLAAPFVLLYSVSEGVSIVLSTRPSALL